MEIKTYQENMSKTLKVKLKDMQAVEPVIESHIKDLSLVSGEIDSKESRQKAHKAVSSANKVLKAYKDARLDLTRPIDTFKKDILAYEKDQTSPLEAEINRIKSAIQAFDQAEEIKRQEELARLEEERRAKIEAERKEVARVEGIRQKIENFKARYSNEIANATLEELKDMDIPSIPSEELQEFVNEFLTVMKGLGESIDSRIQFLEAQAKLEAERKKAEEDGRKEAAKLAEMKAAQEAERRKLEEEKARIEREKAEAEREKARLEAERLEREKAEAERKEIERKIKEAQDARMKGITQGIDSWEITDLYQVPAHILKIDIKVSELKKYLKENEEVPGMKVSFKTGLILNG